MFMPFFLNHIELITVICVKWFYELFTYNCHKQLMIIYVILFFESLHFVHECDHLKALWLTII